MGMLQRLSVLQGINFRINGFNVIIDNLRNEMKKRGKVYLDVAGKFSFLNNFNLQESEYRNAISKLVDFYSEDVESFYAELIQFQSYVKSKLGEKRYSHADLYEIIIRDELSSVFPNVEIAIHIFLTLMITNCSTERSFSQLKRIKNIHRATMGQERLRMLSLMCIESDVLRKLNLGAIIDKFSTEKSRKKIFN